MAGPGVISINNLYFFPAISKLNQNITGFCDPAFIPPDKTSASLVLDEYQQQIIAIEKLLTQYKALLQKDAGIIRTVGSNLNAAGGSV